MSDNKPLSNLSDLTNRTVTGGETISSTDHEAWRNDIESRVADLNDAVVDEANNRAGTSAPTDNTVEGQIWADTTNDPAVLKFDPDGAGADTILANTTSNAAGTGTATFAVGGVIHVDTAQVSKTATGVLMTYTIPANTLDANGQVIRVKAWGTFTSPNTITIQARIGGNALYSTTSDSQGEYWVSEVYIVRTGSAAQDVIAEFRQTANGALNTAGSESAFGSQTEDTTAGIVLDFNISAYTSGTVTQEGMIVEFLG
jgi:hypothetical protein